MPRGERRGSHAKDARILTTAWLHFEFLKSGVAMTYGLLALAALMFGLYNVFIKMSADHINAVLGAVVLQFVAAFVGLGLLLYMQASGGGTLQVSTRGLGLATLAGIAIGLVEIFTFI